MNRIDFARDAFLEVIEALPEASLSYRRPEDDYALGGIVEHVDHTLRHYTGVAEAIAGAGFGRVAAPTTASNHDLERRGLGAGERTAALERLRADHDRLVAAIDRLGDPERPAEVVYAPGTEPFPTTGSAIAGWVTGHYLEHVPHAAGLGEEWRTVDTVERFNARFGAHDVDGFMALMTDDVVFDNTYPPPDGERFAGQAAVRAFFTEFFRTTPGARFETEEIVANGSRATVRWRFDWGDGHVRGVDVFRVRDGKVAEKLSYVKG